MNRYRINSSKLCFVKVFLNMTSYPVALLRGIRLDISKTIRFCNIEGKLTLTSEIAEAEEALRKKIAAIEAREEAEERLRTGSFE